jgi:diamine N-acetyltransferase
MEHYRYLWLDNGINYIKTNFNTDKISEEISDPNSHFFLISDGQQPVGLIKLNLGCKTSNFSEDLALELERIYLIKDSSGKGLGKKQLTL